MKRPLFFILYTTILLSATAQKKRYFDLLSYHVSLSDYQTFSESKPVNTPSFYQLKEKSMGFGINAWKNLTSKFGFSGGLNITFSNFPANFVRNDSIGQGKVSTQLDLLAHLYATSEKARMRPFLSAGLGAGIFPGQSALFAPIGTGLQINFNEGASLLLQAQLRNKLSQGITNNFLFYQIGISQSLSRKKPKQETATDPLVDNTKIQPIQPIQPADTDEDGVPDADDQCPTEKGTINGCPDTDGDKIINKYDSCPTTPGLIKYNGCPVPDTDGDGINDEADKCPTTAGIASNEGCPEVQEEIKQQVNYTAKNILFLFASSTLSPSSYKPLNILTRILNENPLLKLRIEAHTDSIGTDENNQRLSEERAKTVAEYLVKKGISSDRITWIGLGETSPVADNSTERGRAKNRRVEFILRYE